MAKATTSVSDPISLSDALRHVQAEVGSREWAEFKLRLWLATRELRWTCKTWAGRQKYTEKGARAGRRGFQWRSPLLWHRRYRLG